MTDLLCLGLALTDAEIGERDLPHFDMPEKFNYIDKATAQKLLSSFHFDFRCGGSSANTAKAFARDGLQCSFYGAVGRDRRGHEFAQDLYDYGVCASLDFHGDDMTGFTVLAAKPERRAFFHYGAAEKINPALVEPSTAIHAESYLFSLETAAAIDEKYRKQETALKSLSLSGIASSCRETALHWIRPLVFGKYCDILVGNENEFKFLFGCANEQYIRSATEYCRFVAITMGSRGSVVASRQCVHEVPPYNPDGRDIAGVLGDGDAYAGGFLAGIMRGYDIRESGILGAYMAFKKIESSSPGHEN